MRRRSGSVPFLPGCRSRVALTAARLLTYSVIIDRAGCDGDDYWRSLDFSVLTGGTRDDT